MAARSERWLFKHWSAELAQRAQAMEELRYGLVRVKTCRAVLLGVWFHALFFFSLGSPVGCRERLPKPPLIAVDEVMDGLSRLRRTYTLPAPLALSDILDIFIDIWDDEDMR